MFSLAIEPGKLLHQPPMVPRREENNTRTSFFDQVNLDALLPNLPEPIRPVITFAYVTGWRITSEIVPIQWRQVDLARGEVRLDPGSTKNRDGRVFPLTLELRELLERRLDARRRLEKDGLLCPWVFFRMVGRGPKRPKPIRSFGKAWKTACRLAGCPARIPHDFRRIAVRNMVRAGVPERVAMQLTGHKTRSVFGRYNIVSSGDL